MRYEKIKSLPELKKITKRLKARNKRIVFTNGCFELLHAGHVSYLQKAKAMGDMLVVGLNSDSSARKIKGSSRPVIKENDRAKVLSGLCCVDLITIFSSATPYDLIKAVRPDVLVKGGDWKVKDIVGAEFVTSYKGKVKSLPYLKGYSTTDIIKKIHTLDTCG